MKSTIIILINHLILTFCASAQLDCVEYHYDTIFGHDWDHTIYSSCRRVEYKDEKNIPNMIKDSVQHYLNQRGTFNFLNKIRLREIAVEDYKNQKMDLDACDGIRYYYLFDYFPVNSTAIIFGIGLDKNGNVITKHNFPDFSKLTDFDDLITICEAVELYKQKHPKLSKLKIDLIKIYYDPTFDTYKWMIRKTKKKKNGGIWYDYYVDAINGTESLLKEVKFYTISGCF